MVYRKFYRGSLTAGTKIPATTSGFVTPPGYDRIGHIWMSGADHESLDVSFPLGDHPFNLEQIPTLGEIAVNTRVLNIQDFPNGGKAWCGWKTHEGMMLDMIPRGNESTDVSVITVEYLNSSDNFGIYRMGALHWIRGDAVTYGTTTNNTKIVDVPEICRRWMFWMAHGAGSEFAGLMLEKDGMPHTIKSNHGALNAAENPVSFELMNLPRTPFLYHYENTDLYTGTAVLTNYVAYTY